MSSYQPAMGPGGDPTNVLGKRIGAYIVDIVLLTVVVLAVVVPKFNSESVTVPALGRTCTDLKTEQTTTSLNSAFCISDGDTLRYIPADKEDGFVETVYGLVFGVQLLNWIILQGITGASIGKLLLGLRVVRADTGRTANIGWAALRWVLLIVDGLICGLLPGIVLASTTKGHRRLGDMASGTYVVRKEAVGSPILIPGVNTGYGNPGFAPSNYDAPAGWNVGAPPAPDPWGTTPTQPPTAGGWGSPTTPAPGLPSAPQPTPGADSPTWDQARNAYIQYDRTLAAWMQWDDATNQWKPISQ